MLFPIEFSVVSGVEFVWHFLSVLCWMFLKYINFGFLDVRDTTFTVLISWMFLKYTNFGFLDAWDIHLQFLYDMVLTRSHIFCGSPLFCFILTLNAWWCYIANYHHAYLLNF